MKRRLSFALALGLGLGLPGPSSAETVTHGVFDVGLMKEVREPVTMRYRYRMEGQSIDKPFESDVRMEVREVDADGAKKVFFEMFEGPNRRAFGPMAAIDQNPLVLVFLQRDVAQMGNLTGGSPGYFQQQVRRAFNDEAESSDVEIELDGRKLAAKRYLMRPFTRDPNLLRFPAFRDKIYEFVVSADVPGGLYRIASRTPDPADGHLILEESMTFAEVLP